MHFHLTTARRVHYGISQEEARTINLTKALAKAHEERLLLAGRNRLEDRNRSFKPLGLNVPSLVAPIASIFSFFKRLI